MHQNVVHPIVFTRIEYRLSAISHFLIVGYSRRVDHRDAHIVFASQDYFYLAYLFTSMEFQLLYLGYRLCAAYVGYGRFSIYQHNT